MAKHARGPWAFVPDVRDYGNGDEVVGWNVYGDCGAREIIGCEGILPDDDGGANARLIAAAPELLEMLSIARNYIEATVLNASSPKTRENYSACLRRIDDVLAKADGEAQ